MKILILDDDAARHAIFAKLLHGHEVTHARRYADFYRSLTANSPKLVYLDYDLDIAVANPSQYRTAAGKIGTFTGLDAARLLAALPKKKRPDFVIVHSMNRRGALDIIRVLDRAKIPHTKLAFPEIESSLSAV
jgi:CheY-like chemotaxis protein